MYISWRSFYSDLPIFTPFLANLDHRDGRSIERNMPPAWGPPPPRTPGGPTFSAAAASSRVVVGRCSAHPASDRPVLGSC